MIWTLILKLMGIRWEFKGTTLNVYLTGPLSRNEKFKNKLAIALERALNEGRLDA